jgi:hypothetical protein
MAQFNLQWDNTDVNASSNTISQRASYRQKTVGGTFITAGFTPTNDFAKSISSVLTPNSLLDNVVYEFKIEAICTEGGPTANDNGVQEQIKFNCLTPVIVNTETTSEITLDLLNTDITKARFTLKKSSDNTTVYGPTTVTRASNAATTPATSLVAGTDYYWEVTLYATVNGIEVNSAEVGHLGAVCTTNTTTEEIPECFAPSGLIVEN